MKKDTSKTLLETLEEIPFIKWGVNWTKKTSFPGAGTIPIYDIISFIRNEIRHFDLTTRANSVAFSFFISLFPIIILLLSITTYLLPYIMSDFVMDKLPEGASTIDFYETLSNEIVRLIPGESGVWLAKIVADFSQSSTVGLFSFGFLLAIYFSSNGMIAMLNSFEKNHQSTFKQRYGVHKRLIAILLTLLIGLLGFASLLFIIFGNMFLGWLLELLNVGDFAYRAFFIMRWIIMISLVYFSIAFIYRYGPATIKKFRFFSPGVTVATVGSILSSIGFSLYVENFANYNRFYGSIGAIIILLLWIQINSFIILVGFELNASIAVNKDLRKAKKEVDDIKK